MKSEDRKKRLPLGRRIVDLYVDGFKNMTVGRQLWAIILLKLVILFLVFKLFFFEDKLASGYADDESRAAAVRTELLNRR